jgi:hypothetical protein
MLIIVTALDNMRRNFPSIRALFSECQWVGISFLILLHIFPKSLGVSTIRRIKQVSQINTQWCHIRSHTFGYYHVN